jgi:hypothetical protein
LDEELWNRYLAMMWIQTDHQYRLREKERGGAKAVANVVRREHLHLILFSTAVY